MYWDPLSSGTEDTATKVHHKKGYNSYGTMSYCYVCKRWYYHNYPGHDTYQATQGGVYGTSCHAAAAVADVGGG